MNEHFPPDSEDPDKLADGAPPPEPTAVRPSGPPRAERVVAAATSRTAGWMVAAVLAGSLVTLLLVPGRSSPGQTIVSWHRAAFAVPGRIRATGPGHRKSIRLPSRREITPIPAGRGPAIRVITPRQVQLPGRVWVQVPARMPACWFSGQVVLPPGISRGYFRGGHRHAINCVIVRPAIRANRPRIARLPAVRRARVWRVVGPRRQAVIRVLPGQPVILGPGAFPIAGPARPGCPGPAALRGPAGPWTRTSWTVVPGARTSWTVVPGTRTSWTVVPGTRTSWTVVPGTRTSWLVPTPSRSSR